MNTSDGKCANVGTREKLIAPASPYMTHGTQRCCRYLSATTVDTEKIPAAWPDGKCANVGTREKLIAPASPYMTHGTQRCCRYLSATTVATEKIPAAWPDG